MRMSERTQLVVAAAGIAVPVAWLFYALRFPGILWPLVALAAGSAVCVVLVELGTRDLGAARTDDGEPRTHS